MNCDIIAAGDVYAFECLSFVYKFRIFERFVIIRFFVIFRALDSRVYFEAV